MKNPNRQYTGLLRTPASMSWLIEQRASVQGSIDRKRRRIDAFQNEIADLKRRLKAIDAVMKTHEVPVEPTMVIGVERQRPRIAPHGEMGRFLVKELKEANGKPISATELAVKFIGHVQMELTSVNVKDVRSRIRYRLKDLAAEGRAEARHSCDETGRVVEGYWVFPGSPISRA